MRTVEGALVKTRMRVAAVAAATLMTSSLGSMAPVQAQESCVSGAEVRTQVHALVSSLRDDIKSSSTRSALAAALVDTLKTFRGAEACEPGRATRARSGDRRSRQEQLKDANTRVARKAIVLEILALTDQRRQGPLTTAEKTALNAAVAALKQAVVAKTDSGAEGRAVAAAFKSLHAQFVCTPA